ncbi:hypothetical protein GCM10023149_15200 [Mucilaginibacter gynuensis]|uniref:Outer membrane protein beta-barrel domain-containing protein n=1 Tax=Mucilaginibacter gynuensis TaxID=1302236 RepID=A0ABP8G4W9_9SPHI
MRLIYTMIVSLILLTGYQHTYGQAKALLPGSVKGLLKDTARNYILRTATVSIYNAKDSTLLNYQLTNGSAEFNINNLPLDVPLKLEVSYTGYALLEKPFTIPAAAKVFDFKTIFMQMRDITLEEVKIRVPPISMNGDTLEINPSAFKLDSNAVIEDVLRRTPGVQLWGDGVITVNGREIKNVYVDGKPFFGGNAKVALQNLPKQAVQKVQVYREPNEKNLLDSTLTMNLKLKKANKFGMFGKISGGYGTDKRYEGDANLNIYTSKMQIGIVGASNNVNKTAFSADRLLQNSTFKGVGANVDYQPDFRATGITKPTSGGVTFKYDFYEDPKWDNKNTLSADYFIQHRSYENTTLSSTQNTIGNADQVYNEYQNSDLQTNNDQKFNTRYERNSRKGTLNVSQSYNYGNNEATNQSITNSLNNNRDMVSSNTTESKNSSDYKNFNFTAEYQRRSWDYPRKGFPLFNNLRANYEFALNDRNNESSNLSDFRSFINTAGNRKINRQYDNTVNDVNHKLYLEFPGVDDVIKEDGFRNIDIVLINYTRLNTNKNRNGVTDLDTLTGAFINNDYLSNDLKTDLIEEMPELRVQRSFYKSLSNRFNKSLNISVSAVQNFTSQKSRSIKAFQNIDRSYSRLLPKASISASDYQYGEYYRSLSLNYETSIQIPQIWQLAPLADSTNVYNLIRGNIALKEAKTHSLSINFNHSDQKTKNAFNLYASVSASIVNAAIVDSVKIDNQNRREIFYANVNGQRNLYGYFEVRKAFDLKAGQLQLRYYSNINYRKTPDYINGALNVSNSVNNDNNLKIFYSFKDKLAVEAATSFSPSSSKQLLFNTKYSSKNYSNSLSTSYNVTKRFNLSSNIMFNKSTSSNNVNVNFTIWNASATYRMLKGNNAEIKLAALDLLHQNTNIINYTGANSLTTGTQTVLKQYFMATLSYYPRFFGTGK